MGGVQESCLFMFLSCLFLDRNQAFILSITSFASHFILSMNGYYFLYEKIPNLHGENKSKNIMTIQKDRPTKGAKIKKEDTR